MKVEFLLKLSNPKIVLKKFYEIYPYNAKIEISERKNKKYKIFNPNSKKWFHFGSEMEDFTYHRNLKRLENFKNRNWKWKYNDLFSSGYASYHLLW